jgi:hypothetical protein
MDDHKSEDQIQQEISEAARLIKAGGTYQHYKSTDMRYKVIDFAIIEATDELGVIYQALYGSGLKFVRPVSVWLETVEWEGQTVPRFKLIEAPTN